MVHVLGLSRTAMITDRSAPVCWPPQGEQLLRRREQGEPLPYLLGSQGFWSFEVTVTPDVLVPRPDTETLVEVGLAELRAQPAPGPVLDLGTGSGCVALAIASEFPELQVVATDASEAALKIARCNARRLGLEGLSFSCGDWFEALNPTLPSGFSLILSNPPYIAEQDPHLAELSHEPSAALVSGKEGLDAIRIIVSQAPTWLGPQACLAIEHGFDQAKAVRALFAEAGFVHIETRKDLSGHERVSFGRRP